jgi:hypothetical protein
MVLTPPFKKYVAPGIAAETPSDNHAPNRSVHPGILNLNVKPQHQTSTSKWDIYHNQAQN